MAMAESAVLPRLATACVNGNEGLTFLPAWRIAKMIASRDVSPVEVTDHFLSRIEEHDRHVHAFRTVDVDGARKAALEAERVVLNDEPLGPLHGVPLAVKEHVPVAGCNYWNSFDGTHAIAPHDGIEAERLRESGAILIGTTVAGLTAREFGSSSAQPQNAWDRERVCGDSSSGSAAAVAAALVPAAIAVDGLGSTRLPAAFCGLVGLNPTKGRVPWTSWSAINPRLLSNTGPLTRDVRDAATILQVLAGQDGRDLFSRPDAPPDYLSNLRSGVEGVEGVELAWIADPFDATQYAGPHTEAITSQVLNAARLLRKSGARLSEFDDTVPRTGAASMAILQADRTNATRIEADEATVMRAKDGRKNAIDWFNCLFERYDALVTPTIQYIAPTREEWDAAWRDPAYMQTYAAHTAASNLTGYPAISVPAGLVQGMPVGLQIYGRPDSEPLLFRLAQALLEQLSQS